VAVLAAQAIARGATSYERPERVASRSLAARFSYCRQAKDKRLGAALANADNARLVGENDCL